MKETMLFFNKLGFHSRDPDEVSEAIDAVSIILDTNNDTFINKVQTYREKGGKDDV